MIAVSAEFAIITDVSCWSLLAVFKTSSLGELPVVMLLKSESQIERWCRLEHFAHFMLEVQSLDKWDRFKHKKQRPWARSRFFRALTSVTTVQLAEECFWRQNEHVIDVLEAWTFPSCGDKRAAAVGNGALGLFWIELEVALGVFETAAFFLLLQVLTEILSKVYPNSNHLSQTFGL